MTVHFGTDGWRAVIADTFTFDNVRLVAQGIADAVSAGDWGGGGTGEALLRPYAFLAEKWRLREARSS